MVNFKAKLKPLWVESRSLTTVFLLMLAVFLANLLGMFFDPRVITGAPAWLKPAKFSSSVAIFTGTLAWALRYLANSKRAARIAAAIIAFCAFLEIVIIDLQAARGTTSHFNFSTPLDGFLFVTMGVSILVLWLASVWLCVLFFRERFADRPLGWALRLGLLISVMGSIGGGLMTRPTHAQQAELAHSPAVVGAHTVGGPDGGPGLPILKWSTQHGDLRVPHFLGLHGLQAVPLLYFLFIRKNRRASKRDKTRQVVVAAASYAAFTILLGWQALRGQSIATPDGITILALGLWAAVTAAALLARPHGKGLSHIPGGVEVI